MRKLNITSILSLCLFSIALISCKKEEAVLRIISSLKIVNAVPDTDTFLVSDFRNNNGGDFYYLSASRFIYGIADQDRRISTDQQELPLKLYLFPDTLPTSKPLYDLKLQFPNGEINTLFLVGTVGHPDYKLVTAVPPGHVTNNTFGLRFANLSYQSKPVSVYVLDNGEQKIIDGLTYKEVSDYKKYTISADVNNLRFEFRDQESQSLLASYVMTDLLATENNLWRAKNFTIAFKGFPGSADPVQKQSTFLIADY